MKTEQIKEVLEYLLKQQKEGEKKVDAKPKIKVGDVCRVSGKILNHGFDIGDIVLITHCDHREGNVPPFRCQGKDDWFWCAANDLELLISAK